MDRLSGYSTSWRQFGSDFATQNARPVGINSSAVEAADYYHFSNNAFQSLVFIKNTTGIKWAQLPNKATKRKLIRVQANHPAAHRRAFGLIHSD